MAKFIEYKSNPWWTGLYMLCGAVVIPLLACILFIREVISTTGFVVITACGMGGFFLLNEQVERLPVKEQVVSGKLQSSHRGLWNMPLGSSEKTPFIGLCCSFSIMWYCLLVSLTFTYRTEGAWAAVGVVLAVSPAVLLLAVSWGSLVRLRIEGDEVQVIYPFLGRWRNRAFRFGEIASVEVRVVNGRKEVRIVLHDGSSIRYMILKFRFFCDVCGRGFPPFCGFGQNGGEAVDHSPNAEEGAAHADHAGCTPTVQVVSQARLPEAASPTIGSSLRDRLPHASGQDVSLPCCRRGLNRREASRSSSRFMDAAIGGGAISSANCVPNCSKWKHGKGRSSSTSIKPTVASKVSSPKTRSPL